MEIIVAITMMAILAAVALPLMQPGVQSDIDRARAAAVALAELRDAINSFEVTLKPVSFRQNIGRNPSKLSHLSTRILADDATYLNSCAGRYVAAEVTAWSSTGPYWGTQVIDGFAMLAPGYTAQDQLVIDPATAPPITNMSQRARIRMASVSRADAENLALIVDGTTNGTAASSTVAFTVSGSSPITVDYIVLMTNKTTPPGC